MGCAILVIVAPTVSRPLHDNGRVDVVVGPAGDVQRGDSFHAVLGVHVQLHLLIVLLTPEMPPKTTNLFGRTTKSLPTQHITKEQKNYLPYIQKVQ